MARRKVAFASQFKALAGNDPFPWQEAMYRHLAAGEWDAIQSCSLPTGLGKTSVIAVWLIAMANGAPVPRRLVYVVNRRTVVDQTTYEVQKYRDRLNEEKLADLKAALAERCAIALDAAACPLALSTLRGQFADNREWSADPCRPAVICGTVDMIGSRLLFSGYGLGFRTRPLHAAFLGQDALIVHDEAHLEPAFQRLLTKIEREQDAAERTGELPWRKLRVMELTATTRGKTTPFTLSKEVHAHETVKQRIRAKKTVELIPVAEEKKELAERIVKLAREYEDENRAVIVFARSVEDVKKIADKLPGDRLRLLTGTMRGLERERELIRHPVFQRFMPESNRDKNILPAEGTVYLVCTSAGEVGVNLSADDLVCDLSTFESMAQRFGRVNRFGLTKGTQIQIVHPMKFKDDPLDTARRRTLTLLESLEGNGSPEALGKLIKKQSDDVAAAFSPAPVMLDATEMLFDAWALTTIDEPMPGRPAVEPFLHGLPDDWQPPETQVAWRLDVELLTEEVLQQNEFKNACEALELYPLKPHELLCDRSDRVFGELKKIAQRAERMKDGESQPAASPSAWVLEPDHRIRIVPLSELVRQDKETLWGRTVLLPPAAGGLNSQGLLDGDAPGPAHDVADEWYVDVEQTEHRRYRIRDEELDETWRLIRSIELPGGDDVDEEPPLWNWYERPQAADNEGSKYAKGAVLLKTHVGQVEKYA